jgi:hypothetical protein
MKCAVDFIIDYQLCRHVVDYYSTSLNETLTLVVIVIIVATTTVTEIHGHVLRLGPL